MKMSFRPNSAGKQAGSVDRDKKNKNHFDNLRKSHHQKDFLTFNDEKVVEAIETFTHKYRLLMMNIYPVFTADSGMANLINSIIDEGHISGHMKDEVAGELAGLIDYCENLWTLFGQVRNEFAAHTLVEDPTFSDITPTTGANHTFCKPESMNILLETLTERNLVVPVFLLDLLKMFTGVRCKLCDKYELYGTEIPASYLVYGVRDGDIEDLEALRDAMFAVKGLAIQHMNKFGMSYVKFETSMLTEPREIEYDSPTFWIFQQLFPFIMYGNDAATYEFDIAKVVDWTAALPAATTGFYAFLKGGEVPPELKYCLIFGSYNAANNPYGGFFAFSINAAAGDTNMFYYTITSATVTLVDIVNDAELRWLPFLWPFFGSDDLLGADKFDLTLSGDAFAATIPVGAWTNKPIPFAPFKLMRTTKTITQTVIQSFLIKGVIQLAKFK